jgi:serine/threonine protein kinase
MGTSTPDLERIERLFHEARAVDPAERSSLLDCRCADDAELRREVESLLSHATDTVRVNGPSETPPSRIGPYKIVRRIGEGGFGVVYMAEQQEPVRRPVALKVIKPGMDTQRVIARFESERQALALMDHPNIARVLDAGATETGRPYFVMELVRGTSITEYCDQNRLRPRTRLELLLQVCQAVQHAHQKGIIHRDLKPSNILVTVQNREAVPKIIDFGIAKATSGQLTEKTLFTEFRQLVGTPEYMSPDQAEISGLDVDTRTDIYSLGVLLYELLTGTTPIASETLLEAGYEGMHRVIREVDPPRPSTRMLSLTSEGAGAEIARLRRSEPRSLCRLLRGDLDWIVMRAMEKDRTRRYQSASELATDIERHLSGRPILAGPPSVLYKARKFVQRHRLGVTAALLILAALVTGTSLATVGLLEARRETARSQRIADFLQDLFISTSPDQALSMSPDIESVLATARDVFGDDHATVAATLSSRALQLQSSGNLEAAERLYHKSLSIWREQLGDDNINIANTLSRLGLLEMTKGDDAAAEEAFRESLRIISMHSGRKTLVASETQTLLATVLTGRGAYDEAEALLREAARMREELAPQQRLQIALTYHTLARTLSMGGRVEKLRELAPTTIKAWRAALPDDSVLLATLLLEYGSMYANFSDHDRALPYLHEAVSIYRRAPESPFRHRLLALRILGSLLEDRDVPATEIVPLAIEAVEVSRLAEDPEQVDEAVRDLGNFVWRVAKEAGHNVEAYRAAAAGIDLALAERPDTAAYVNTKGVLQYRLGEYRACLETLADSHRHYVQQYEHGVPADLAFMTMAYHRLGRHAEARETIARLRAAMEDPRLARSEDNLAHLAEAEAVLSGNGHDAG